MRFQPTRGVAAAFLVLTVAACREPPTSIVSDPRGGAGNAPLPVFDILDEPGTLIGTTTEGELVEIDLTTGTVYLIGDAGTFNSKEALWSDLAFDGEGNLFTVSRRFMEPDNQSHLYTIDPETGEVIQEIGNTGAPNKSDIDFDGETMFAMGRWNPCFCARLMSLNTATGGTTFITSTSGLGDNPFDTLNLPIAHGGLAVHPITGDLWGIEVQSDSSDAPSIYRIDAMTGVADSIVRLGLDGVEIPAEWGFDALAILANGTFITARSTASESPDSQVYVVDAAPDPTSGLAELTWVDLTFDTTLAGSINGLEVVPGLADELVVTLDLSRDTVRPVVHRVFDAVSQVWSDAFDATLVRADTVRIQVTAIRMPSATPVSGGSVRIVTRGVLGSGGHVHTSDPRPPGSLYFDTEAPLNSPGVLRDTLATSLDPSGVFEGFYRSAGIGGRELIEVTVLADGDSVTVVDTVAVRWPNLQAVPRSGTDYVFTEQNPANPAQRHGNNNHFLTPGTSAAFVSLFAAVRTANPAQAPFNVTDASLEWGGLLDIDSIAWRQPHRLHRGGIHADVGFSSFAEEPLARASFADECGRRAQLRCEGEPADSANHFHVTYSGSN